MACDDSDRYECSTITDPETIRLMEIQPSSKLEAPIQCKLRDKNLAQIDYDIFAHYIALSHVWGDGVDRCAISVVGKAFDITATLDSALRHIRDPDRVINVWADGVCVNQNDIDERNTQVGLMGSIYSMAHHTIIFLGDSTPEIGIAMTAITRSSGPDISASTNGEQDDT